MKKSFVLLALLTATACDNPGVIELSELTPGTLEVAIDPAYGFWATVTDGVTWQEAYCFNEPEFNPSFLIDGDLDDSGCAHPSVGYANLFHPRQIEPPTYLSLARKKAPRMVTSYGAPYGRFTCNLYTVAIDGTLIEFGYTTEAFIPLPTGFIQEVDCAGYWRKGEVDLDDDQKAPKRIQGEYTRHVPGKVLNTLAAQNARQIQKR